MDTDKHGLNETTQQIIGCAYTVANGLGCGFLEKVYENALAHELRKSGITVEQQKPIQIRYDGLPVGDRVADLLVNDVILIEVKAAKALDEVHAARCLNYLKATKLKLCLLINFGTPRIAVKRIINDRSGKSRTTDGTAYRPGPVSFIRVHPCPSVVPKII